MSDPTKVSNGHSSTRCYKVEARISQAIHSPAMIEGNALDTTWRQVTFTKVPPPFGVKAGLWNREAEQQGYLSHDSAMALGWWFLSNADLNAVEVRLVQFEFIFDFKVTRLGEGAAIERTIWKDQFELVEPAPAQTERDR